MLPDIQPGNTKILYFFNCLLDGMHTKQRAPICDFLRYEKISSQKFLLKYIDFDSVVKNTKVAKSIILMRDLSNGCLLYTSFTGFRTEKSRPVPKNF